MAKTKWYKVGTVMSKKNKPGVQVVLGNKHKEQDKSHYVTITVKDSKGNVIAENTDGFLQIQDPRKSPFMKNNPDKAAKIPEFVKQELFLVTEE